jgi:hypothetical protein
MGTIVNNQIKSNIRADLVWFADWWRYTGLGGFDSVVDLICLIDLCGNGDIAIHGGGMKQKVVQLREL